MEETVNGAAGKKVDVDWTKFGLAETSDYHQSKAGRGATAKAEYMYTTEPKEEVKELFEHEQENANSDAEDSWWKSSFFVTSKLLFGTWDGVFTTCVMNMIGVVVFLRSGWMVGYAGTGLSLLIVLISFLVALATVMSAVGICDRCHIGKGGVYFIITHVLGGRIGGAIGLLYCIGHATATALYCTGFAESLVGLINWNEAWAIRIVSIITLIILLGIAISGVKWIIRFQLILIVILAVAMLDFVVGTIAQEKPEEGFTGFSNYNFEENLKSEFTDDISFFVVFGVFFPTACGVLAGVNMSGDLKDPGQNIPEGSVASLGVCGALYTIIVLFLGSTCSRVALQSDYMIMEKISLVGALFIFGLFVASLSSSLGGLVGPPRVLQSIAEDDVLPILKPFAKLQGVNQEPRNATLIVSFIALMFMFVGNLNTLAPIVTMPFLATYTAINYSYFAMAMSYDIKKKNALKSTPSLYLKRQNGFSENTPPPYSKTHNGYGALSNSVVSNKESIVNTMIVHEKESAQEQAVSGDVPTQDAPPQVVKLSSDYNENTEVEVHPITRQDSSRDIEWIEEKHSNELYAKLCNRWVSLIAALVCILLSFSISWVYALANLSVTLLLYVFISQARSGSTPGVSSDFHFGQWLCSIFSRKNESDEKKEHVVIQTDQVPYGIAMYQVTQDNSDYEHRDRKHLASLINKPVPYH